MNSISGQLKLKNDTIIVSDKFQKREFILLTEQGSPYPQQLSIQLSQDKCAILDSFNVGDEIDCKINLKGREWNGPNGVKYFNTIECWGINLIQKGSGVFQG